MRRIIRNQDNRPCVEAREGMNFSRNVVNFFEQIKNGSPPDLNTANFCQGKYFALCILERKKHNV